MGGRNRGKENHNRHTGNKAANRSAAEKAADAAPKKRPVKEQSAPAKQKKILAVPAPAMENDEPEDEPLTPERAQQLLEELRVTKAKLAEEQTARKAAQEEVAKVQTQSKKRARKVKTIRRPKGTCGREYHLRNAMRLGDRKDGNDEKSLARKRRYSKILSAVRDIAILGGLKWRKGIRFQDPVALGAVYEVARKEVPYLARFENNWVTAQIISQFFMNRRRHEIKKGGRGKNHIHSPEKATRKRILGKVMPVNENRGDRGSPGANDQEDPEAGQEKGADGVHGDEAEEDVEGLGVGEDDSDRDSDSSDSEKDYGDAEEDEDEEDEEDEDEEDEEDEDDDEDEEESDGRRRSSRKKRRLT